MSSFESTPHMPAKSARPSLFGAPAEGETPAQRISVLAALDSNGLAQRTPRSARSTGKLVAGAVAIAVVLGGVVWLTHGTDEPHREARTEMHPVPNPAVAARPAAPAVAPSEPVQAGVARIESADVQAGQSTTPLQAEAAQQGGLEQTVATLTSAPVASAASTPVVKPGAPTENTIKAESGQSGSGKPRSGIIHALTAPSGAGEEGAGGKRATRSAQAQSIDTDVMLLEALVSYSQRQGKSQAKSTPKSAEKSADKSGEQSKEPLAP